MSRFIGKVIGKVREVLFIPGPSLLDIFVCLGVIPIGHLKLEFQGLYLVFFTFLLLMLSIYKHYERSCKNIWLVLIGVWAFIGIFIHSWCVNSQSVAYRYLNFYLMSEGFIYIFAGIMYLHTVVNKCSNLRLLWITIPIALVPMFQKQVYCGQMSYILALMLGIMVYNAIKKRFIFTVIMVTGFLIIALYNMAWLIMKFNCRPYVWIQMLKSIAQYPLFGSGFNKYLIPNNMIWVEQIGSIEYGWLFRHNDYLSITSFLGVPILIPIIGFVCHYLNKFKNSWKLIIFSSFVIVSFFQITMFDAYKAFIILTTLGYLHIEA